MDQFELPASLEALLLFKPCGKQEFRESKIGPGLAHFCKKKYLL